jgi:phytoene synthase
MSRNSAIDTIADVKDAGSIAIESSSARAVIRRHSRSFSIASRLLPNGVRGSVYALYAWCRTVDDAVDEASSNAQAAAILNQLDDDLDRMHRGQSPLHAASLWIEPLVVQRRIDVIHAKELIEGMRMDLHSFRVNDQKDLQRYCYHAAGTVGLMMTRLMGVGERTADQHAIALGVAMQLTNIARDVREDALRGRSYLPGIPDPLAADPTDVRIAVQDVLVQADRQYEIGGAGLRYLPWRCRFAIRIAASLYREIGRQIERNGYNVLCGRTVISKSRLVWVLAVTLPLSIANELKFAFGSITQVTKEDPMEDTKIVQVSTVAQAKHAVYLGLSLTAIMSAALFVMVFMNPKDESYSYLPLVYSGASLFFAILFNRLAARCESCQPSQAAQA